MSPPRRKPPPKPVHRDTGFVKEMAPPAKAQRTRGAMAPVPERGGAMAPVVEESRRGSGSPPKKPKPDPTPTLSPAEHVRRAEILPVGPDFAMYFKGTTSAFRRCQDEQRPRSGRLSQVRFDAQRRPRPGALAPNSQAHPESPAKPGRHKAAPDAPGRAAAAGVGAGRPLDSPRRNSGSALRGGTEPRRAGGLGAHETAHERGAADDDARRRLRDEDAGAQVGPRAAQERLFRATSADAHGADARARKDADRADARSADASRAPVLVAPVVAWTGRPSDARDCAEPVADGPLRAVAHN